MDPKQVKKMIRFTLASGLSFLVTYGTPIVLVELLGLAVLVATAIGFLGVMLMNFAVQKYYVFESSGTGKGKAQLVRFILFSLAARSVEYALFALLLWIFSAPYQLLLFMVLFTGFIVKFLVLNTVIFKER